MIPGIKHLAQDPVQKKASEIAMIVFTYPEMAPPLILPIIGPSKRSGLWIPLSFPPLPQQLSPIYLETSHIVPFPHCATSRGLISLIQAFVLSSGPQPEPLPGPPPFSPHPIPSPTRKEDLSSGVELKPGHSPTQQPSVAPHCLCSNVHFPLWCSRPQKSTYAPKFLLHFLGH